MGRSSAKVRLDDLPDVLFTSEVAQVLRTSERAVRYYIQQGRLRAVKPGHRLLVPKAALMQYLGIAAGAEYTEGETQTSAAV